MKLTDPVSIYIAETNLEAQLICNHLVSLGIQSYAVEDTSGAGTYSFGLVSQFHKPEVFVEREHADKARTLIEEYEASKQSDAPDDTTSDDSGGEPQEYCHACGERVSRGTPTCPECERPLDWSTDEASESTSSNFMATLKSWKKPIVVLVVCGPIVLTMLLDILAGVLHQLGIR